MKIHAQLYRSRKAFLIEAHDHRAAEGEWLMAAARVAAPWTERPGCTFDASTGIASEDEHYLLEQVRVEQDGTAIWFRPAPGSLRGGPIELSYMEPENGLAPGVLEAATEAMAMVRRGATEAQKAVEEFAKSEVV